MSNRYKQHKLIPLTWATLALLSACSMAPRYQQPTVPLAPEFPSSSVVSTAPTSEQWNVSAAKDLGWREYFADERLQRLIELALANNKDLRVAALNVETVRAQYAIARADRLPAIGATGSATKARVAEDLSNAGRSYITESYNVGLGVASFELDLFGRVKSLSDNALNQYFAQEQARDATQISLVATVAKA
ncbi:MAG: TolC family protein, partial [Burkholderiales bacterium]|nr:TolC family protein [Burkholderiales bacterium]